VLTVAGLRDGAVRFNALRRRIDGVSEKMLAQTLRQLEADGLVHRDARPVVPPHVEYSLTDRGAGLAEHMVPLMAWIAAHAPAIVSDAAAATSAASVTR
jgi:DNA-binding HxlR family transcriptional regulator